MHFKILRKMKKIFIAFQCALFAFALASCEKEPYKAADLEFNPVYRVYDRAYADANGVQEQTAAQKKIFTLDKVYQFFAYRNQPVMTSFTGNNFKGAKISKTSNFVDKSEAGVKYHFTFDRTLVIDSVDYMLKYEVFYDQDRKVYEDVTLDEKGDTLSVKKYQKPTYVEIKTVSGEVICRNDFIGVLEEERAL